MRHAHFEKNCDFAQIWSKSPPKLPGNSLEALRRLSGDSLEALRRLSGDSLRPSVSPRPWDSPGRHFVLKPLCFSVESEKETDSPQSGEGDMHEVL